MPIIISVPHIRYDDGIVNVELAPQQPIGGWEINVVIRKRFGGPPGTLSGLVVRSCASGYNNVSGVNVLNSGLGQFAISLDGSVLSGQNYGNYALEIFRTGSGVQTMLANGFIQNMP